MHIFMAGTTPIRPAHPCRMRLIAGFARHGIKGHGWQSAQSMGCGTANDQRSGISANRPLQRTGRSSRSS